MGMERRREVRWEGYCRRYLNVGRACDGCAVLHTTLTCCRALASYRNRAVCEDTSLLFLV